MSIALALAAILALYFLVRGPRAVRYSSAVLVAAWILAFVLGLLLARSTPFPSMARLYADAAPFAGLLLVPWVCAGVRLARSRSGHAA